MFLENRMQILPINSKELWDAFDGWQPSSLWIFKMNPRFHYRKKKKGSDLWESGSSNPQKWFLIVFLLFFLIYVWI